MKNYNNVRCVPDNGGFICDLQNISVDIDLGFGTWLAIVLICFLCSKNS